MGTAFPVWKEDAALTGSHLQIISVLFFPQKSDAYCSRCTVSLLRATHLSRQQEYKLEKLQLLVSGVHSQI